MRPFTGAGAHRYTKRHLRHDRDAAREECRRLRNRLRHTASELGNAVVEVNELQTQLARALDANEKYATAVSTQIGVRDTSAIEDQATVPRGVQHVGDEFPDDYLDQRREKWQPTPLQDSPLAKAPVGPAVLAVELGDPTPEQRFPATARVLSRLLDEANKVTVSGGPRAAAT
jgi:hypothetical protein